MKEIKKFRKEEKVKMFIKENIKEEIILTKEQEKSLERAEKDIKEGRVREASEFFKEFRQKYGI